MISISKAVTEKDMDKLYEMLPCRKPQLNLLCSLMDEEGCAIPGIFVYGHSSTGKTSAVKLVAKHMNHRLVHVNCVECYSARLLFESILEQLDATFSSRCDNGNAFVIFLREIVNRIYGSSQSIYILLERAERLRDFGPLVLPMLLRLQELSDLNVGVILESQIVWEKFRSGTGFREPYIIHFPEYSKEELATVLCLDCPQEELSEVYQGFVGILLNVFHLVCRNLSELRYLATLSFDKYIEPVKKGDASFQDTMKLWKQVEPHLKKSVQTVYLRETTGEQWMKMEQTNSTTATTTTTTSRSSLELPVYTKYLLIASYLASYNPAKSDKKFFMKNSGKTSKRSIIMSKKKNEERTSGQILGPKYFPLDRLMAMFYSIVEDKVVPTANTFSQISSLVTLGLLAKASVSDQFESQKFKCLVTLDQIKSVSKSVDFEVLKYLYDFI